MAKSVLLGKESIEKVIKGIDTVADTVKVTLGPKGRNIILSKVNSTPLITNDGATIAKEIELKDPIEDTGARLIRSASDRTNKEAGDGTTTTAILTQALITEGLKSIEEGIDPIELRDGMNKAAKEIVEGLKSKSKTIESIDDIKKIATISSGSELIGSLIGEAYEKIGNNGAITVEESKTNITSIEIKEGYRVPVSPMPAYYDDRVSGVSKSELDLDNVGILVSAGKIDSLQPFGSMLQEVANQGGKIIIFAESISSQVATALLINNIQGFQVFGIDLNSIPDKQATLADIAISTGAKLFNPEKGVNYVNVSTNDLGMAGKVKFKKEEETLLIDCAGEKDVKEERVEELKKEIEENKSLNDNERTRLQKRISGLNKGIAIINLGSSSEVELGELKLRVEDALCSVRSSLEEGVVAGAGSTFINIVSNLNMDENCSASNYQGQNIVKSAVNSLLRQILINAQYSDTKIDQIVKEVTETGKVYNLVNETYEDPDTTNVFDPTKVERLSLETAVSVASSILVTSGIVTEEPETVGDTLLKALGIQN